MFELNKKELEDWRCQFGTSNSIKMGLRHQPMAFTEQGVAMLSSVLNSKRAIDVNIAILRAFVRMREILVANKEFSEKLKIMEEQLAEHDDSSGWCSKQSNNFSGRMRSQNKRSAFKYFTLVSIVGSFLCRQSLTPRTLVFFLDVNGEFMFVTIHVRVRQRFNFFNYRNVVMG